MAHTHTTHRAATTPLTILVHDAVQRCGRGRAGGGGGCGVAEEASGRAPSGACVARPMDTRGWWPSRTNFSRTTFCLSPPPLRNRPVAGGETGGSSQPNQPARQQATNQPHTPSNHGVLRCQPQAASVRGHRCGGERPCRGPRRVGRCGPARRHGAGCPRVNQARHAGWLARRCIPRRRQGALGRDPDSDPGPDCGRRRGGDKHLSRPRTRGVGRRRSCSGGKGREILR